MSNAWGGRGGGLAERTACIAREKAPEQEDRQTPSTERVLPLDKAKAKGRPQAADQEQNALGVLPGDACTRSLHLLGSFAAADSAKPAHVQPGGEGYNTGDTVRQTFTADKGRGRASAGYSQRHSSLPRT